MATDLRDNSDTPIAGHVGVPITSTLRIFSKEGLAGLALGSQFVVALILIGYVHVSNKWQAENLGKAHTQAYQWVQEASERAAVAVSQTNEDAKAERVQAKIERDAIAAEAREERKANREQTKALAAAFTRGLDELKSKVDVARREAAATRVEIKEVKKAVEGAMDP